MQCICAILSSVACLDLQNFPHYLTNRRIFLNIYIYRVFQDLWTLLQEVISYVFVIKKVHINMCPILDSYGVMGIF